MSRLPMAVMVALLATLARAETVDVYSGDSFAPLVFLKDGRPAGLLARILIRASEISGDTYRLELFPWMRAYILAERGQAGILGLSYTEERAKSFDYSTSVYDNDIYIVTRTDRRFNYTRLEDLKGKKVGAFVGESFGEEVDKAVAIGLFTIERDQSNGSRLLKLLAGRIDAAFIAGGQLGLRTAMANNPDIASRHDQLTVLSKPLAHDALHLAFAKGMNKSAVLSKFNQALVQMNNRGEIAKLTAEEIASAAR